MNLPEQTNRRGAEWFVSEAKNRVLGMLPEQDIAFLASQQPTSSSSSSQPTSSQPPPASSVEELSSLDCFSDGDILIASNVRHFGEANTTNQVSEGAGKAECQIQPLQSGFQSLAGELVADNVVAIPWRLSITDQKDDRLCWMFAALNIVRAVCFAPDDHEKTPLQRPPPPQRQLHHTFQLSQYHLYLFEKLEKADNFFVDAAVSALLPTSHPLVSHLFSVSVGPVREGNDISTFFRLLWRYGAVPLPLAPKNNTGIRSRQWIQELNVLCHTIGARIRGCVQAKLQEAEKGSDVVAVVAQTLAPIRTRALLYVYQYLTKSLGHPVQSFELSATGSGKGFNNVRVTPVQFAHRFIWPKLFGHPHPTQPTQLTQPTQPSDQLTSQPPCFVLCIDAPERPALRRYKLPFGKNSAVPLLQSPTFPFSFSRPPAPTVLNIGGHDDDCDSTGTENKKGTRIQRLSLLKCAMERSLSAGFPVWFGADYQKDMDRHTGHMRLVEEAETQDLPSQLPSLSALRARRCKCSQQVKSLSRCCGVSAHNMVVVGVRLKSGVLPLSKIEEKECEESGSGGGGCGFEQARYIEWYVDNSHGENSPGGGRLVMSDAWFDVHVFGVGVRSDFLCPTGTKSSSKVAAEMRCCAENPIFENDDVMLPDDLFAQI